MDLPPGLTNAKLVY